MYRDGNFEQAFEAWQRALYFYRRAGDKEGEGEALGHLALIYAVRGERETEINHLSQSLLLAEEVKNVHGELRTCLNLGNTYQAIGEYREALGLYQRSLALARDLLDKEQEASLLNNIGSVYYYLGDRPVAINYYQQSLEISKQINRVDLEAKSLVNLGNAYGALGEYDKALDYQQQRLAIANLLKDNRGELFALINIAYTHDLKGDWAKSLELNQQALNIARKVGVRQMEGVILANIGSIYNFIGQESKAAGYFETSLLIRREVQDLQGQINALEHLGSIYCHSRDLDKAQAAFNEALVIAKQIQSRQEEGNCLAGMGNICRANKDYNKALLYFEQSLQIARQTQSPTTESSILEKIGLIHADLDDYQAAASYFKEASDITRRIQDVPLLASNLNNLGVALLSLNQVKDAETVLIESLNASQSLFSKLGIYDNYKLSFFESVSHTTPKILQNALILQNRYQEALEVSEQGRARAFADLLSLSQKSNQVNYKTIDPISLAEIQAFAKHNHLTIVEYSIIYGRFQDPEGVLIRESELYTWVVSETGEISFHKVDLKTLWQQQNTSLSSLVVEARSHLTTGSDISEGGSLWLKMLYQILISKISHLLPKTSDSSVMFVPQEILFLVPFTALQDESGKFLVEHFNIVVAPSIQVILLAQQRDRKREQSIVNALSTKALVVGNPQMPTVPFTDPPMQLPSLAWAAIEANAVSQLLRTGAVTGYKAKKAYIQSQMQQSLIIHIATHGLLDDIWQSGIPGSIALAPSEDDNGFLTASEIYEMQLIADLVVLSACDTGQGKITGDGVVGLSRCLIAAGASRIVVSLWTVSDLSTALLMVKLYQELSSQLPISFALNKAQ